MTAVVIGESLVDVVVTVDGERETPGGSPFNVAVGVARLRGTASLLTAWGGDRRGDLLRQHLETEGVHVVSHLSPATSTARARIRDDGSADYAFEIDGAFAISREMETALADAESIHVGSIAAHLDPGAAEVRRAVAEHRAHALVSYDPNCRPALLADRIATRSEAEQLIALADVVKASDEDLRWLYPDETHAVVAERWLALGARLVVVTRGADGIWCASASGHGAEVPAAPTGLVDTIGAGDSTMAALISGLLDRGARGPDARRVLDACTVEDLGDLLRHAASAAAITCSREGADPPTSAEVLAYGVH